MPVEKIDSEQFDQGRAAYARGATVRGLVEQAARLETIQPNNEDAIPSLLLGFGEGLLADIREIHARSRSATAAINRIEHPSTPE